METFLCDKCVGLFYNPAGPTECPYCNSVYVTWVSYPGRSKKEVKELMKKAESGIQQENK